MSHTQQRQSQGIHFSLPGTYTTRIKSVKDNFMLKFGSPDPWANKIN